MSLGLAPMQKGRVLLSDGGDTSFRLRDGGNSIEGFVHVIFL
jgi:hypothetical protein